MISCPTIEKSTIRFHYDLSTVFYRLLWGQHIHHGLWDADESPRVAQLRLTEMLAVQAGVQGHERVLDVGCGMGGSSIHLAQQGCDVTGITLSPLQRIWASLAARWLRVGGRTRFHCQDAEQAEFAPSSFDIVWSIECTEHLFDKPRFFQRVAEWLRPGGRVAICAWLAGDSLDDQRDVQRVYDVCEGFLCPSLGSMADYQTWLTNAGFTVERSIDLTDRVARTWEICRDRVERWRVRWLARVVDRETVLFLDRFQTILDAYRTGAMRYGCLIARK